MLSYQKLFIISQIDKTNLDSIIILIVLYT